MSLAEILGETSPKRFDAGARYDAINQLKCEIQTRTVLQDAWAIIQHHLVYKHEKKVPSPIQRALNGLAGLFEVADEQYVQLRLKHQRYVKEIESKKFADFLEVELNVDTLKEYMSRKFPSLPNEGYDPQKIYYSLKDCNKLRDVNELVDRTEKARNACIAELNMVPTRESTLLLSNTIWWVQKLRSAGLGVDEVKAQLNKQDAPFHPTLYSVIQKNLYLIEVQELANVLNASV